MKGKLTSILPKLCLEEKPLIQKGITGTQSWTLENFFLICERYLSNQDPRAIKVFTDSLN